MDGVPIAWAGPFEGRRHDSTCVEEKFFFPHYKEEMILADSAYGVVQHCLVPYKKRHRSTLAAEESLFNREHRRLRTTIERLFAAFDKHHVAWYTHYHSNTIEGAFSLLMLLESVDSCGKQRYSDTVKRSVFNKWDWQEREGCACKFCRDAPIPLLLLEEKRWEIMKSLNKDTLVATSKPSAHSKFDECPTPAKTAEEQKQAFKDYKESLAQETVRHKAELSNRKRERVKGADRKELRQLRRAKKKRLQSKNKTTEAASESDSDHSSRSESSVSSSTCSDDEK